MNKRALAQQLLAKLGETLTLESLTLDEATNTCILLFEENLVLNIEFNEDTGRLVLSSYLGELPEENAEPLLRELLTANLYWVRTQGATLALEEDTDGVILSYAHGVSELDRAGFKTLVENFVNQAEKWSRRVAAGIAGADGSASLAVRGARAGNANLMMFG